MSFPAPSPASSFDLPGQLRARGFVGEVALRICDLDGQELLSVGAERSFPAASTIKVPLLIMALQLAQRGELNLEDRVVMTAADRVPGAGVLHELDPGLALSWRDVLTLMIVVSDNTATNLTIERLGLAAVDHWLASAGLGGTRLVGKLQLPPEQRNEAQRRGERNRTTAFDQSEVLVRLVRGEWLDQGHTELCLSILGRQQYRDLIGRAVPSAPDGLPLYRVASKSGELDGVHHDVGVIWTPRPLVVALLSEGGLDPREHPENRDMVLLARELWPVLASLGQTITSLPIAEQVSEVKSARRGDI